MRPIATDRVVWSVGRSVGHDCQLCKRLNRSRFRDTDLGGPREPQVLGSPMQREILRGMTSKFSHMQPNTVSSGLDIGISLHPVDEHSDWQATEAVGYHIKFSR